MKIGVIAPSFRPEICELRPGLDMLEIAGFEVVLGRELLSSPPRFTSPFERREQRAGEFIEMWKREDIDALWACDGGAGALYLLPELEHFLDGAIGAACKPKVLFGFSDITFLQMFLAKRELQAWMTPNIWDASDKAGRESFHSCLSFVQSIVEKAQNFGEYASGCVSEFVDVLRPGEAKGNLLCGNFTCLTHLAGTKYAPSFDGAIVLTEDHTPDTPGQHEYLFWEKLQHLTLSGDWNRVAAFIFGDIDIQGPYADDGELHPSIYETIEKTVGRMSEGPIITTLPFGLFNIERPLPIGVEASLIARDGRCELEW